MSGVPFVPDWTMHPGAVLREELPARGITEARLAELTGLSAETVAAILTGTIAIDSQIAGCLETALGAPPAGFWLNFQANYDRALARGATDCTKDYLHD